MRKAIGIIILGLLVCSTADAKSIFDYIKIGDSKDRVKKYVYPLGSGLWRSKYYKTDEMKNYPHNATAMCYANANKYFPKYKTEITTHIDDVSRNVIKGTPWYVFENVTKIIIFKSGHAKILLG
jgi:hypothetical protein|tara:strand:+ start:19 stop:390 length:372 start_codon:yes stop_codon:yes gene_type:complete